MEAQELSELLDRCLATPDGSQLSEADAAALTALTEEMPRTVIFPLLLLRHGHGDAEALRQRVAILSSDPRTQIGRASCRERVF